MQDYNYWHRGCYELTIEITCCKYPNADQLSNIWTQNQNALISYLKLANTGVKGVLKFSNNQPAANLSIQINSIEPIFKTSSTGEYYRLLLPGNYTLRVLMNCNQIYTINFTVSKSSLLTVLNITLSQTLYNSYIQQIDTLNNDAQFCKISRQQVACANTLTTTKSNFLANTFKGVINNFNLVKCSILIQFICFITLFCLNY